MSQAALTPAPASAPVPSDESHRVDIKYLIRALVKYNASDLHLKVGRPPIYRINGKLVPAKMAELNQPNVDSIIFSILTEKQKNELSERKQIDFSFRLEEYGRFRCNVFYQRGCVSAAIRMIPLTLPRLDDLRIPSIVKELCHRQRGLILVTGSTGSGKSTTLAAIIQHINETSHVHILTIEDPIEYVFRDMKASISQREVGSDTHSLQDGIHAGLRQDPDIIVIGELRDAQMIQAALQAAETGHLVLATVHTNDAKSTIDRILDMFPSEGLNQARVQIASTLVGVISQQLVARIDGTGRIPACEIMIKSPTIENYILKGDFDRILEAIEASGEFYKMQSMNQALEKLVTASVISAEEAIKSSGHPDDLRFRLGATSLTQEDKIELVQHPSIHRKG